MKIYVENVVEKNVLEKELENSNIQSAYIPVESAVLGRSSLVDGKIGYFEVQDEDGRLAKEIYDNIRETRQDDAISVGKRNQVVTGPRILVSLLILALLGVISYLLYDNSRLDRLRHYAENTTDYTRKWNSSKTILSRYFKDSGLLEAEFFDTNFNGKWEEEKFYDKHGKLSSDDISPKDDGVFRIFLYYDQNGTLIQRYRDSEKTDRNDDFEIATDPNTYYEFSATPEGPSYYTVRKVVGQLK